MNKVHSKKVPAEATCTFVDAEGDLLFLLPSLENIEITHFDGTVEKLPCEYIDEKHFRIGDETYTAKQFAGKMLQIGAVYAPEHPRDKDCVDTYEIFQVTDSKEVEYKFRPYLNAEGKILSGDYDRVFAGMLGPKANLDLLWRRHNLDSRPFGQTMRSLSVSDIVVLNRSGEKHAFYIDLYGAKQIDWILTSGFLSASAKA